MAYRMTRKRRAALRKAQLASARKRRKRGWKRKAAFAAGGVGILPATAGAGIGVRYIQALKGGPPRPSRPHIPGKELVHVPGHGKSWQVTQVHKKMRRKKPPKLQGHKMWRVDSSGVVTTTRFNADNTKGRNLYNYRRRRAYWRSKPVGGRKRG